MQPTIWMNVTTSVNWQRPSVGVVRVERALCEELARLYPAHQFKRCVWERDRFVEWTSPSIVPAAAATPTPHSAPAPTAQPMMFPLLPRPQALAAIAQGLLSLLPNSVRPKVNRLLMAAKPRLVNWILHRRARLNAIAQSASEPTTDHVAWDQMPFKRGDVLVSVGLDWDYGYYHCFYRLRRDHGVQVVSCCYDLIPVIFPQYCVGDVASRFTSYFLDVAEGSALTLCISKQSEGDLHALLAETGGRQVPTQVFPLGDNVPPEAGEVSAAVAELLEQPFILLVSTIERRKNHEVLYRAYRLLCEQGRAAELPKMVFVGMRGWGVGDLLSDIALDPLTRDHIVLLHQVSDGDLRRLYEKALFCVYPSFYEGWGLPVGEALALGKVVLSSNRGSLPEVGGDLVVYIDPWQPQAWAEAIWTMTTQPAQREALGRRVAERYRVRTWSEAAQAVKAAIDHIAAPATLSDPELLANDAGS